MSYFVGIMVLAGIFQSTGWPSVVSIMANWFGKGKRGLVMGVWNAHTSLGNIAGTVIAAACLQYGWGYSFIVPGIAISVLGAAVFLLLTVQPADVGLAQPGGYSAVKATDDVSARRRGEGGEGRGAAAPAWHEARARLRPCWAGPRACDSRAQDAPLAPPASKPPTFRYPPNKPLALPPGARRPQLHLQARPAGRFGGRQLLGGVVHPRRRLVCAVPLLQQAHRVHLPLLAPVLHQIHAHPGPHAVGAPGGRPVDAL